ncbi:MAG: hypothetical protein ACTHJP_05205, partial [Rhodanobacteraceae bacterium]
HKDAAAEMQNKLIGLTSLDVDVKRAADELGMSARDARDTRTALDDALQFGTGFTVDGKRIDPARVVIYHGHPNDDAAMAQESGDAKEGE